MSRPVILSSSADTRHNTAPSWPPNRWSLATPPSIMNSSPCWRQVDPNLVSNRQDAAEPFASPDSVGLVNLTVGFYCTIILSVDCLSAAL
jgi:hypothetical protein